MPHHRLKQQVVYALMQRGRNDTLGVKRIGYIRRKAIANGESTASEY
jgi:hypothetical protein